ncbi:hypothetical protein OKW44_000001, partial [Paraburkholderia sp. WSM4174]
RYPRKIVPASTIFPKNELDVRLTVQAGRGTLLA